MWVSGTNHRQMLSSKGENQVIPFQKAEFPLDLYEVLEVLTGTAESTVVLAKNKKTKCHELFGLGKNKSQHLTNAVPESCNRFTAMSMAPFAAQKILFIAAGEEHIVLQAEDHKVYGVGLNDGGQLGVPTSEIENDTGSWQEAQLKQVAEELRKKVSAAEAKQILLPNGRMKLAGIYCGAGSTILLLADRRHLIVYGVNEHHLGVKEFEIEAPLLVDTSFLEPQQTIKKVTTCYATTCILTEDGTVFMSGYCHRLKEDSDIFTKVDILPPVQDIFVYNDELSWISKKQDLFFTSKGIIAYLGARKWIHINMQELNLDLKMISAPTFALDSKSTVAAGGMHMALTNGKNQVVVTNQAGIHLYHDFGVAFGKRIVVSLAGKEGDALRYFWKADETLLSTLFASKPAGTFNDVTIQCFR